MDLTELGITTEELQDRLIDKLAEQALDSISFAPAADDEDWGNTKFARTLDRRVKDHIDSAIAKVAEEHVLPKVSELAETLVIQQTNTYGEPKGEPLTFIEYMVAQVEKYITEKVDWGGKTKAEAGYNWSGKQTRIVHMIHQHLHSRIESILKAALTDANAALLAGVEETVKIKLGEIAKALKLTVKS